MDDKRLAEIREQFDEAEDVWHAATFSRQVLPELLAEVERLRAIEAAARAVVNEPDLYIPGDGIWWCEACDAPAGNDTPQNIRHEPQCTMGALRAALGAKPGLLA
jgi:hypothetical protein